MTTPSLTDAARCIDQWCCEHDTAPAYISLHPEQSEVYSSVHISREDFERLFPLALDVYSSRRNRWYCADEIRLGTTTVSISAHWSERGGQS